MPRPPLIVRSLSWLLAWLRLVFALIAVGNRHCTGVGLRHKGIAHVGGTLLSGLSCGSG